MSNFSPPARVGGASSSGGGAGNGGPMKHHEVANYDMDKNSSYGNITGQEHVVENADQPVGLPPPKRTKSAAQAGAGEAVAVNLGPADQHKYAYPEKAIVVSPLLDVDDTVMIDIPEEHMMCLHSDKPVPNVDNRQVDELGEPDDSVSPYGLTDNQKAKQEENCHFVHHRRPAYDPRAPINLRLECAMFDNHTKEIEQHEVKSEGRLANWIVAMREDLQDIPDRLFLDMMSSTLQPRATGRYLICQKLWNGLPFYYSRMSRLYLFNASDDPRDPEWAVARNVRSTSYIVLMKGDIKGDLDKVEIYAYDKRRDPQHAHGHISEASIAEPSRVQRRSMLKITLDSSGSAPMFRRATQKAKFAPLNLSAFVRQDKTEATLKQVVDENTIAAIKAQAKNKDLADLISRDQAEILKKEHYLARHAPILVFKTLGAPTSVVGVYLPIIDEYAEIFPNDVQNVLVREKTHVQKKNPEEDYLDYPKYYCCENDLYLFFNPKKGQWKVINSSIMHRPHAVKVSSDLPTKACFPPLVDMQNYYECMIQFPTIEGKIVDALLEKQGIHCFVDHTFPPERKTIAERGRHAVSGEIEWYRARDLHDADFPCKLFDNLEPADVIQGGLGDCWLLAALAVVAEYPDFIPVHIFHEKDVNIKGKYHINLFDYSRGRWIVLEIDDFIPCYPKSPFAEQPMSRFVQPRGNEIWMLLLEKAFAKLVGGYMNLKAGYAGLSWMCLTGCMDYNRWIREKPDPAVTRADPRNANAGNQILFRRRPIAKLHDTGQRLGFEYGDYAPSDLIYDDVAFLKYLHTCEKNNFLMACVGVHGMGPEHKREDGLVDGHAYSVLQIIDIACLDGKVRTLIKLRNPWGDFHEWTGPFGDNHDASWALVKNNGAGLRNHAHDGIFFMEASAFLNYYTHIEVLHYNMRERTAVDRIFETGLAPDQKERRVVNKQERQAERQFQADKYYKPNEINTEGLPKNARGRRDFG